MDKTWSTANLRLGVVLAEFNQEISEGLWATCQAELSQQGVQDITLVRVAGALEIPLLLQKLAQQPFDALIALGAVIKGETYHFEIVANESARGIMTVQLNTAMPIINGVLTTYDDAQALARLDKGAAAAKTAIDLLRTLHAL